MATLLIQNNSGGPQRHALNGGVTTIGRDPENTIVLDHPSVSSHHAKIIRDSGALMLHDLESANGTTLNGMAITEVPLKHADRIAFGPVECLIENASENSSQAQRAEAKIRKLPSLSSRLSEIWNAASGEAQRSARLVGSRTRIAKLKLIDLKRAHYALGKKCHDLGLLQDHLYTQRKTISDLEAQLKAKRPIASQGTDSEKVRRIAGEARIAIEREVLTLKLKTLLTEFGKQIASLDHPVAELDSEREAVDDLNITLSREKEKAERLYLDSRSWIRVLQRPCGSSIMLAATILILCAISQFAISTIRQTPAETSNGSRASTPSLETEDNHGGETTSIAEETDELPFDIDRAKAGLTAHGFKFTGPDIAENRAKTVTVAFTLQEGKLTSIKLTRLIRIEAGQMKDFNTANEDMSAALGYTVGTSISGKAVIDIVKWHHEPMRTNEWFDKRDVVSRSKASRGFIVQSIWQHWDGSEGERGKETLLFTGIPSHPAGESFSVTAQEKEARVDSFLKFNARRVEPTGKMSWLADGSIENYAITERGVTCYIAKLPLDGGKWSVIIPTTDDMSTREKDVWRVIFSRITMEITGVDGFEVLARMRIEHKNPILNGWYFSVLGSGSTASFAFSPPEFITGE